MQTLYAHGLVSLTVDAWCRSAECRLPDELRRDVLAPRAHHGSRTGVPVVALQRIPFEHRPAATDPNRLAGQLNGAALDRDVRRPGPLDALGRWVQALLGDRPVEQRP